MLMQKLSGGSCGRAGDAVSIGGKKKPTTTTTTTKNPNSITDTEEML